MFVIVMDSFDKVNDGVNFNKCVIDDNVRMVRILFIDLLKYVLIFV